MFRGITINCYFILQNNFIFNILDITVTTSSTRTLFLDKDGDEDDDVSDVGEDHEPQSNTTRTLIRNADSGDKTVSTVPPYSNRTTVGSIGSTEQSESNIAQKSLLIKNKHQLEEQSGKGNRTTTSSSGFTRNNSKL